MSSTTNATTDDVRWGVLGLADIALRAVIPAIQACAGAKLHAVATRGEAPSGSIVDDAVCYAGPDSYARLLADPNVDAVYIPVPNHLHSTWAIQACEAGKHVLCEKPLGVTPDDVAAMTDASERCSVLLMEAFMYRYNPQLVSLKELIGSGGLGDPRLLQASFTVALKDPETNVRMQDTPGAGALFDVGVYAINTARWMFGAQPSHAYARAQCRSGTRADEVATVVLEFPGDRLAVIDCALSLPYRNHFEIVGTRGSAFVDRPYASPPFQPARDELVTVITDAAGNATTTRFPEADQYRLEIDAFCRAVRGDQSSLYPTTESKADAAVLAACLRSMQTGRSEAVARIDEKGSL
jgi:predicted dehydrogenase